jgi:hypothetical protein
MKRGWIWAVWLLLIAVSFSLMEAYALYDGDATLSRFVWVVTYYFPPFPYLCGFLAGFLTCHFWWGGIVPFAPVGERK